MALNKTGTLVNYTDLCITSTFFQLHYSPPQKKIGGEIMWFAFYL